MRNNRAVAGLSRTFGVRATDAERAVWVEAAGVAGLRTNSWVRRALRLQAELELALAREEARDGGS